MGALSSEGTAMAEQSATLHAAALPTLILRSDLKERVSKDGSGGSETNWTILRDGPDGPPQDERPASHCRSGQSSAIAEIKRP
jgi:hypothetical protein